jgi:TRAP-type C4-dicarboxylate transport system permease small subunit
MVKRFSVRPALRLIEKGVCIAALVSLVLIAAAESVLRIFNASLSNAAGLLAHILLVLGLFSCMFTAGAGEHLSIVLIHYVKNEQIRRIIALVTGFTAVVICTIVAWSSVSFVKIAIEPRSIGLIPNVVFALAMPLAYGVTALRLAMKMPVKNRPDQTGDVPPDFIIPELFLRGSQLVHL